MRTASRAAAPGAASGSSVLERLVAWGQGEPSVRAMVLTSTRANPHAQIDALSDYDVILFVPDALAFATETAWQSTYAKPLGRWGDEAELYGEAIFFRGVVYEDGVKIDWSIWPDRLLELIARQAALPDRLDVGYRVLLDKDGRTTNWKPPTDQAHIPGKPTADEYRALVEEFWWSTTYVAKGLWRGEIFFAKWALDHDLKFEALRRLLEWRIEIDHDWSLKPGAYGRGLERLLPHDLWSELASTYVSTDIDENWDALFRVTALFRRVAIETGDALGFAYPDDLDAHATEHLKTIRELPRAETSD